MFNKFGSCLGVFVRGEGYLLIDISKCRNESGRNTFQRTIKNEKKSPCTLPPQKKEEMLNRTF